MTRRTAFNGSASGRRRERLKLAAIARGVEATQEVISSEKLHRPTPSRAVLTLSRKVDRVEKALIGRDTKVYDSADNRCLPQVAIFQAGHRTVRKDAVHIIK